MSDSGDDTNTHSANRLSDDPKDLTATDLRRPIFQSEGSFRIPYHPAVTDMSVEEAESEAPCGQVLCAQVIKMHRLWAEKISRRAISTLAQETGTEDYDIVLPDNEIRYWDTWAGQLGNFLQGEDVTDMCDYQLRRFYEVDGIRQNYHSLQQQNASLQDEVLN